MGVYGMGTGQIRFGNPVLPAMFAVRLITPRYEFSG